MTCDYSTSALAMPPTWPHSLLTGSDRRLIALDIDGTILRYDGSLPDGVSAAVEHVERAGHEVVIATGRSLRSALPVIRALGLRSGYAVCSNGTVTLRLGGHDGGLSNGHDSGFDIVETITFEPRPILATLRERFPRGGLAVERVGVGFDYHGPFPVSELDGRVREVSWVGLTRHDTNRVTFCDPHADVDEFAEHMAREGLHGVNYAIGYSAWLDIVAPGVSKASALEAVRRRLQVPREFTVAVGDQRNDVEMLAWAGCGVAMGNAPAEVAAAANFVTGHVDDHGLVDVLAAFSAA